MADAQPPINNAIDSGDTPGRRDIRIPIRDCLSPLLVVAPDSLDVVEANDAAHHLLNYESGCLVGRGLADLIPGRDDLEGLQNLLFMSQNKPSVRYPAIEIKLLRADGFILLAEAAFVALLRSSAGEQWPCLNLRDVTQHRVAQEQLLAENQSASYQHLVEGIADGLLALDGDGDIVFANTSAERILGQSRNSLIGCHVGRIFPNLSPATVGGALIDELRSKTQKTISVAVEIRDQLHQFELSFYPQREGLGVIFRDVTERVKHEMEIAKLSATMAASQELLRHKNNELNVSLEKLARLNAQLAQIDQLKSEFLSNTSHELRTPLNSIIGFLQLIGEGLCENHDEELEYVRNCLASAQHLLALITDMLDIAKIEEGQMTLLVDDIDLRELFNEIYLQRVEAARRKSLKLTIELDESILDYNVRADYRRTRQILLHLIDNSIKFTSEGEIRLWTEPDPQRNDMIRFCINDTGIGVPLDRQAAIFEKFTQVDGTSTRKYQGTGLGLAITRNLVEMMGGEIQIHSPGENRGTTIIFTLPIGSKRRNEVKARPEFDLDLDEVMPKTF
ncbi:MAG: ATP-binding protein [bacterium]|nr:ATP-binding protein [bacterium]